MNFRELIKEILQLTSANDSFDGLINIMIEQYKSFLSKQAIGEEAKAKNLDNAMAQLESHRQEFESLLHSHWEAQITATQARNIIELLSKDDMQFFFKTSKKIEREIKEDFESLSRKMYESLQ